VGRLDNPREPPFLDRIPWLGQVLAPAQPAFSGSGDKVDAVCPATFAYPGAYALASTRLSNRRNRQRPGLKQGQLLH
jgi:hypothetical protein